ncbi:MAG: mannose-6-phosphate isomerase, class I [Propionicimonas sp.]|nr:mannose-6-phosphate isomerase, class I [Propionicimonas sp.]
MTTPTIVRITNRPREYSWGIPGGISRLFGWAPTSAPEAELWLGSHPLAPSQVVGPGAPWPDLAGWQASTGSSLPFLLKVLAADSALSLQAHPTTAHARLGYADEEAAGIPLTAPARNYKDPYAKPELIVAVEDGFEALCGFRPVAESRSIVERLGTLAGDPEPFAQWRRLLAGDDPLRSVLSWLLSGDGDAAGLVAIVTDLARRHPGELELAARLAADYPGDPGILIALMLNHASLRAGECLWMPAGNIHAYLRGVGIELMGPSDNVLRGGLTPKHVDVAELMRVLDFSPSPIPHLVPERTGAGVLTYRPADLDPEADPGFVLVAAAAAGNLPTAGHALCVVLEGEFTLTCDLGQVNLQRGEAALFTRATELAFTGRGRMFVAAPSSLTGSKLPSPQR